MSDWQPIDTIPKDGTMILVYTVHGDIEITYWCEQEIERYEPAGDGLYRRVVTQSGFWNSNRPSHWMPLPPMPADAAEARERVFAMDD